MNPHSKIARLRHRLLDYGDLVYTSDLSDTSLWFQINQRTSPMRALEILGVAIHYGSVQSRGSRKYKIECKNES